MDENQCIKITHKESSGEEHPVADRIHFVNNIIVS